MKIEDSKYLEFLADEAGKSEDEVSDIIVDQLINEKGMLDEPENYGLSIDECDFMISEIAGMLHKIGIGYVKSKHVDAFGMLVIMGDGDCPYCGGDSEILEEEVRCVGGDGYEIQPEYESLCETHKCNVCGKIFFN